MADAAVSVLVIIGLVAGRQFGWVWMDPIMGLVATIVILSWSWTLIRSAGSILLVPQLGDNVVPLVVRIRVRRVGDLECKAG